MMNSKVYPAGVCDVSFFRVFDLADFFKAPTPKQGAPVHFLKNRTNKDLQRLFQYSDSSDTCTLKNLLSTNASISEFSYCTDDFNNETTGYMAGLIRRNLRERFFYPTYKYNNSLACLLEDSDDQCYQNIAGHYKEDWFNKCKVLNDLSQLPELQDSYWKLKLTISPYGTASVRLNGKIPISSGTSRMGDEFAEVQKEISALLRIADTKDKQDFESTLCKESKDKDGNKKNSENAEHKIYPSLLSFISLAAIWRFLKFLTKNYNCDKKQLRFYKDNHNQIAQICRWFVEGGGLESFNKIWEICTSNRLPLRHELSFFYFQDSRYEKKLIRSSFCSEFIDNVYSLGLLVSSLDGKNGIFSSDFRNRFKQEELCITDNGTAHFVGGSSLIVAVKPQKYTLQGLDIEDYQFWDWMFRLICCLRECFILGDICSRNLRELRMNYDELRGEYLHDGISRHWWKLCSRRKFDRGYAKIQDELAQLSSLLFTVEEGINSVMASRMPFVQEKLQIFSKTMRLPDLIENVSKRRENLESRMHNETTRLVSIFAFNVAMLAFFISVLVFLVGDNIILREIKDFHCFLSNLIEDWSR
ncbi:hypothetical protein [Nitrosomonas sp.]|uniref:hypothetical protein n=1 Tax=Nitrosomonas sp. TaxID=42353 RepID=UPI00261AB976|nr:hypothetical protein [Nitrosomonas sp.]